MIQEQLGHLEYTAGTVIVLAVYAFLCWKSIAASGKAAAKVAAINTAVLLGFLAASRFVFPGFFHEVVFDELWLHLGCAFFVLIAGVIGYYAFRLFSAYKMALSAVYGVLCLVVLVGGCLTVGTFTSWRIFQAYPFASRSALVEVRADAVRFTPLAIAYRRLVQKMPYSQFTVEQAYLNPIDVGGGFGYAAPITPDGLVPTFTARNPGVMVFDDRPAASEDNRVSIVRQRDGWAVGDEMRIFDNLPLRIFSHDPCADYQTYYLDLGKEGFVAVASRTKYRLTWPLVFVPYWDGVTLVHPDGRFENLDAAQALSDARLRGKRLFPEELARDIVRAQQADKGPFSDLYNRPDKIKVPELPGDNQMPFLTDAKDGNAYWVVATEPAGNSHSLYRIYYVDAYTGSRSVYNCNQSLVGPEKAIDLVEAAPELMNVTWETQGVEHAQNAHQAIESVYVQRKGRLYWKVTITTSNLSSITTTAVVDALSTKVLLFDSREVFQRWLNGEDVGERSKQQELNLEEVGSKLRDALTLLDQMKRR